MSRRNFEAVVMDTVYAVIHVEYPISKPCTFLPAHWRLILLIHDFSLAIGGKLHSEYLGFSILEANDSRNIPFFLDSGVDSVGVKVPVGTHGPMGMHLLKKNFPTAHSNWENQCFITMSQKKL